MIYRREKIPVSVYLKTKKHFWIFQQKVSVWNTYFYYDGLLLLLCLLRLDRKGNLIFFFFLKQVVHT